MKKIGIELDLLNLGGGLPANYIREHKKMTEYSNSIKGYLEKHFGDEIPETIIMEPGRSLFGNCGVMATSVVLIE